MYGSLNALFTGLALVGVGLTIWMQSEQMRRQRAEYEAAETARREELKIAREQLEMAKIDHGNALEREKRLLKREQRQAEPVFVFTWDKFANQGYTLSNAGGAVTHVAATPGKVLPDDYCSMDRPISLEFGEMNGFYDTDFDFSIGYVRVLDLKHGRQSFRRHKSDRSISRVDPEFRARSFIPPRVS